jgi:methionyl-tRNA formyltransferase
MGSPEFALPCLDFLATTYNVVGVVTQPDRRSGRGRKMTMSRVKERALDLDLPTFQPQKIRDDESIDTIRSWDPELIVVAAFGQILSLDILEIPTFGSINIHASLLPRWRGAAPIQAAIFNGDEVTGISIMLMDEGLDTGPVLAQEKTPISDVISADELSHTLASLGAETLERILPEFLMGNITPQPQDDQLATHAPSLRKADGILDFSKSAIALSRQVRAFHPWPGSFFEWNNQRIVVHEAVSIQSEIGVPGKIILSNDFPAIVTKDGLLGLMMVQPAGRKVMTGDAFLLGHPDFLGVNILE